MGARLPCVVGLCRSNRRIAEYRDWQMGPLDRRSTSANARFQKRKSDLVEVTCMRIDAGQAVSMCLGGINARLDEVDIGMDNTEQRNVLVSQKM